MSEKMTKWERREQEQKILAEAKRIGFRPIFSRPEPGERLLGDFLERAAKTLEERKPPLFKNTQKLLDGYVIRKIGPNRRITLFGKKFVLRQEVVMRKDQWERFKKKRRASRAGPKS